MITDVSAGFDVPPLELGTFFLPVTDSWANFETDANSRRPQCGPYFPSITEDTHGFLLPLVRLVDPRTNSSEYASLVTQAEDFFGPVHESEAELAWNYWPIGTPPSLSTLLSNPASSPALINFYKSTTFDFLLLLALRFEYAVLFGFATSDRQAADNGAVQYHVYASWEDTSGRATSRTVEMGQRCSPAPPAWTKAERSPGSVPHRLFQSWPDWVAPPEMAPEGADGQPMPLRAPRGPAAFTALGWAAPPLEPNLIGYGPVLYEVRRFSHGAATAAQLNAPQLPANALFEEVIPGDLVIRSEEEPHYLDLPNMEWPPLEGWYSYKVLGVDLLGVRSAAAPLAVLRHYDDFAPPPPGAALLTSQALTFNHPGELVDVRIRIDWGAAEDFGGQDTVEFRVAETWVPLTSIPVHVESVVNVDELHADLTVTSLPGTANQYAGLPLSMPGFDFPIFSHGSGSHASIRVRKVSGTLPSANVDGAIYGPGPQTPLTRLAKMPRLAAVAGTVDGVLSTNPMELRAVAADSAALPTDPEIQIYVHVLRLSFDAERVAPGRYRLTEPPAGQSAAESLKRWRSLANPAALLAGSPLIFFPRHSLIVRAEVPADYVSGMLVLGVSAADGTSYVASPVLPVAHPSLAAPSGNESTRTELTVSLRSLAPPAAVTVPPWDPNTRIWALTAANFAEFATHQVTWTASPEAARYEVWRVPEGGLPGVNSLTSDADLRAVAAANPKAFELRSDQVFSSSYEDSLPGRAPTRALYKVRAVSLASVPGAWSDIMGPIYVPDIRRPQAANLLRVTPSRLEETDRSLALEWTLAGSREDVRFDILVREASASNGFAPAGSVPRGTAADSSGRYRWLHDSRTPGRRYAYQVIAVREALDPIDPTAVLRRDIAGPPSSEVTGTAISYGPMLAPSVVTAALDSATGMVKIAWTNNDVYESIEVWRRPINSSLYICVGSALPASTTSFGDTPPAGQWGYQVRGFGIRREARSEVDAEVTIP